MASRATIQEQIFKQFQESKKRKEKEEKDEESTRTYSRKIELMHGELINKQQILQEKICQTNKITYYKDDKYFLIVFLFVNQIVFRFLQGLFKHYFYRFGNSATIIIIFILLLTPVYDMLVERLSFSQEDYLNIYIGQLAFGLVAILIRDLYIFQTHQGLLSQLNQSQYTLFQKFSDDKILQIVRNRQDENGEISQKVQTYTSAEVSSIQIGDIILLKKGDLCPADCLILDMKESFCSVKNNNCQGSNQFDIKRPPQVTQILSSSKIKGYHFEYRKILNGRIEFVSSNENQQSFEGYVKLNKDPNGENINDQNMIFRGQELMYTEWCVALVLYVGYDCRYFQIYRYPKEKIYFPKGSINNKIEQYFFLTYLFIIIFTLVSSIIDFTQPFNKEFNSDHADQQTGQVSATYFLEYMIFLPCIVYPYLDIMQLIIVYKSRKIFDNPFQFLSEQDGRFQEDDEGSNEEFQETRLTESTFTPIDDKQQGDMCLTTHAIFSKSGTLMHNEEFVLSSITIGNKMYKLNIDTLTEVINTKGKPSLQYENGANMIDPKVPSCEAIDAEEGVINNSPTVKRTTISTNKQNLERMQACDFEMIALRNNTMQSQTQPSQTTATAPNYDAYEDTLLSKYKEPQQRKENGESYQFSQNGQNNSEEKNSPASKYEDSPYFNHRVEIGRFSSSPKSYLSGDYNEPDQIQLRGQAYSEQPSVECSPTEFHSKLENLFLRQKNDSYSISQSGINTLDSSNFNGGIEKFYKNSPQQNSSYTIEGLRDSQTPLDFSSSFHNTSKMGQNSIDNKNDLEFIQEERDFLRDLQKNDQMFASAIKAIGVAHLTKTKYIYSQHQFFTETLNPQDKIIQEFIQQIGFQFRCSNKMIDGSKKRFQYIYTNIQNETKRFTFLIPPAFNERKTRLCVIVKEDDSKKYTLYLKEELVNFPNYILLEKGLNRQDQEKRLKKLIELGQIPIAYCKRELDELEAYQIQNQYENALKVPEYYQNKEQIINYIYSPLLTKLDLLCIVGIQEVIRKDSAELVNLLNQSFIKTWMLTGDQFQKAVPAAYSCRILQKDSQCQTILFDCSNYKSLKSLIKNYIVVLKSKYIGESQIKKNPNDQSTQNAFTRKKTSFINSEEDDKRSIFNIIISGKTFNLIRKNQYLNDHFTFLLYFTKNLVGYQFDQFQKAEIIQNLKICLPNAKILGIGSNISDLRMLTASDYSIEIVDFQKKEIYARSNSIVRTMKDIIKQLAVHSKNSYFQKEDLVIMNFYRSFLIGIILFFWNTYQSSYGISLLPPPYLLQLIYFTPLVLFIIQQLKIHKWKIPFKKEVVDKVQTLIFIIHNQTVKRDNLFQYLKSVFIQSVLEGLFIFLIFIFQYQDSMVSTDGQVLEKEMIGLFLFQTIHILLFYKYLLNRKCSWKLWVIGHISLSFLQLNRLWDINVRSVSFVVTNMSLVCSIFLSFTLTLTFLIFMPLFQQKIKKASQQFYDFFDQFKQLVQDKQPKKSSSSLTKVIRQVFQNRDMERALEELNTDDISISQSKTHLFTLKFLQLDTENKYIAMISLKDKRFMQISLIVQILLQELAQALIYSYELKDNANFNSLSTVSAILTIIWFLTLTSLYTKYFIQINNLILIVRIISRMNMILTSRFIMNSFEEIVNNIILSQSSYINPIYFSISLVTTTVTYLITFFVNYSDKEYFYFYDNHHDSYFASQTNNYIKSIVLVFQVSITILIVKNKYRFDQLQRLHFQKENHLSYETKKIQSILSILMPKFIRDKIDKDGEVQLQEDQGDVSILFCDICDFEQILSTEQENIVRTVDKLFRHFDGLCAHTGLQKIETVGKTYMAAGGLKDAEGKKSQFRQINPVARAVIMSFEMMEAMKSFTYGDNEKIKIKIGIHYGRVIAGVIGCHKPQFSLIGDTVNMASRVCSTGDIGQVTISDEAYEEIKQVPHINFLKKKVYAKGKGDITTYQVTKKQKQKNQNSSDIPLRDQVIQRQSQKKHSENGFKNQLAEINTKNLRKNKTTILKHKKFLNDSHSEENFEYFNSFNFQLVNPQKQDLTKSENKKTMSKTLPASESQSVIKVLSDEGTTQVDDQSTIKFTLQNNQQHNLNAVHSSKNSYTTIFSKVMFSNGIIQKPFSSKVLGQQGEAIQEADEEEDKKIDSVNKNQIRISDRKRTDSNSQAYERSQYRHKTTSLNNKITTRTVNSPSIEQQNNIESSVRDSTEFLKRITNDSRIRENSNHTDLYAGESIPKISKFRNESEQIMEMDHQNKPNYSYTLNSLSPDRKRNKLTFEDSQTEVALGTDYQLNDTQFIRKNKRYLSKELSKMWSQKVENPESSTIIIPPILALEQELDIPLKIDIVQEVKEAEVEIEKLEELQGDEKFLLKNLKNKNEDSKKSIFWKYINVDNELLKVFRVHQTDININIFRRSLFFCISSCLYKMCSVLLVVHDFSNMLYSAIVLQGLAIALCIAPLIKKNYMCDLSGTRLSIYMSAIYYIVLVSILLEIYYMDFNDQFVQGRPALLQVLSLPIVFIYIVFMRMTIFTPKTMILKAVLTISAWFYSTQNIYETTFQLNYLIVLICILQLLMSATHLKLEMSQFNHSQILEARAKKQNDILMYLLPEHILSKFLNNPNKKIELIDHLDNVTFLFADIAGFTKYSGSVQPENVVNMLRILFNEFDQQCQKKNLYKIYTIGDCYVVIGTKNANNRLRPHEEARNVVELGFEMIEIIKKVRSIVQFEELEMRIGVHTGSYIGGVIGTDIVRYDIYGPDVMVANKMESNGEQGKVMVSKTTMNLLLENYGNRYNFNKGNDVFIKQFHRNIEGYFISQNLN